MAGEDPGYCAEVRSMRCLMAMEGGCVGRIEAHHAGRSGMAMRAHDDTTIPLCTLHHRNWHDANGPFKGWVKEQRREWAEFWIERIRRRVADRQQKLKRFKL